MLVAELPPMLPGAALSPQNFFLCDWLHPNTQSPEQGVRLTVTLIYSSCLLWEAQAESEMGYICPVRWSGTLGGDKEQAPPWLSIEGCSVAWDPCRPPKKRWGSLQSSPTSSRVLALSPSWHTGEYMRGEKRVLGFGVPVGTSWSQYKQFCITPLSWFLRTESFQNASRSFPGQKYLWVFSYVSAHSSFTLH